VIAAPASVVTDDGRPSYIDLKVTRPEIYFGDGLSGYAVVNTSQKEQACPGVASSSYEANGGIQVDGLVRRVALAINFGEFNLFGSNLITAESEIMLVRDVRDRVKKIAPFLHFDADPYPVVINGQVKWIIDAFTTSNRYPYAETANVSQISRESGLNHSFNYVRNSVKAVVDAYTGEATFYLMDTKDPIAKMWKSAFPKLFTDKSEVPAELAAHFRYPEDLFRVQTNLFGRYQFDDATLFFNRDAAWTVSQAPIEEPEGATPVTENPGATQTPTAVDSIDSSESIIRRFSPYYTIFHAPGQTSGVGQFSMLRPFAPFSADDSRKELRSLMVVSSDPESYGKMTVYDVQSPLPPGPATVAAEFESDAVIAQIITPLDLRGSRVKYGDLQVVPIGRGLMYIRPLFVLPDSADSKQIFVRKILASYDGRSVIGDSITDVVTQLFPGFNVNLGDRVGGKNTTSVSTTTIPGAPVTTVPAGGSTLTPAQLLQQAERLFIEADAALAKTPPDFATYQSKLAQARALVQQALTAVR
jgi:uncharacterized membrane protein (UPF0182 family)